MNRLPLDSSHGPTAIPWDAGYHRRKFECIATALNSKEILDRFRTGSSLPQGYGVGIDERCIEYPWFFSRLPTGRLRLLDAGSACNHPEIIGHPLLKDKELHILTLAPEDNCFWRQGISYLFADLRSTPIRDAFYEAIVCISTLEHVGMDNTFYTGNDRHRERDPLGFLAAARELWRILAPDGVLYITLPYGRRTDLVIAQQFDWAMIRQLLDILAPAETTCQFFRYTADGWQSASRKACDDATFVSWVIDMFLHNDTNLQTCLPVENDLAAGARAVACLELRKATA